MTNRLPRARKPVSIESLLDSDPVTPDPPATDTPPADQPSATTAPANVPAATPTAAPTPVTRVPDPTPAAATPPPVAAPAVPATPSARKTTSGRGRGTRRDEARSIIPTLSGESTNVTRSMPVEARDLVRDRAMDSGMSESAITVAAMFAFLDLDEDTQLDLVRELRDKRDEAQQRRRQRAVRA